MLVPLPSQIDDPLASQEYKIALHACFHRPPSEISIFLAIELAVSDRSTEPPSIERLGHLRQVAVVDRHQEQLARAAVEGLLHARIIHVVVLDACGNECANYLGEPSYGRRGSDYRLPNFRRWKRANRREEGNFEGSLLGRVGKLGKSSSRAAALDGDSQTSWKTSLCFPSSLTDYSLDRLKTLVCTKQPLFGLDQNQAKQRLKRKRPADWSGRQAMGRAYFSAQVWQALISTAVLTCG